MCLVLTGIHAYLGVHVLAREVVFVDIAMALIATFRLPDEKISLADRICANLAFGELPHAKPETVWAASGTGEKCAACGLSISAADVECDVDLAGGIASIRLHRDCLVVWDEHREDPPPIAKTSRKRFDYKPSTTSRRSRRAALLLAPVRCLRARRSWKRSRPARRARA
jgi:hypothetical protein